MASRAFAHASIIGATGGSVDAWAKSRTVRASSWRLGRRFCPPYRSSLPHILIREEPVIRLQLLLGLQQAGADVVELGILQVGHGDDRRARRALADFAEAGGQQLVVERAEALL